MVRENPHYNRLDRDSGSTLDLGLRYRLIDGPYAVAGSDILVLSILGGGLAADVTHRVALEISGHVPYQSPISPRLSYFVKGRGA